MKCSLKNIISLMCCCVFFVACADNYENNWSDKYIIGKVIHNEKPVRLVKIVAYDAETLAQIDYDISGKSGDFVLELAQNDPIVVSATYIDEWGCYYYAADMIFPKEISKNNIFYLYFKSEECPNK